ncbi:MAG: hypothetical protein LUO89_09575, partial [Methanothrix sp.]|nr:hypothetical protein [Methanothrix sp.]
MKNTSHLETANIRNILHSKIYVTCGINAQYWQDKISQLPILTSKFGGCVDAGPRGVPHVARFIQQRIEHQRDRQKNRTQPWDGGSQRFGFFSFYLKGNL